MNAETTPTESATPKVIRGGRGEIIFAMNAATVVMTASPSGVDSLAHAANQASELSSISARSELYLR